MAILDPRVLELIETLVAARLDWLAFELIEGIRVGRLPDEPEQALAAARQSVRSNAQPKARGEPHILLEEPKPIPADEQVEWAAAYVEERLDAALEQLQASLETLDFIVDATIERQDPQDVSAQASGKTDQDVTLVLLDLEGDRKSNRDDVSGARDDFPTLRAALAEWTTRARGQATT
ncbi:MAG: hypothetical protein EOR36_25120 [Mesorhizobium sp.]|uniref:hypothetical protein n=1 Tax=Mesorhizobium sp. TaxID=1871066 RepID=UPI000FE4D74E|nr:hypothetical protein [Mesorhizobium sp.]RWJ39745.1 MAG: hypothetical protein EOR29_24865 [Mesorhizobium sp.]RWJ81401.1 MAG: hypothetical protein EOR36_25120 [Mesorhizobium sp.]TIR08912.1 MAG: hypothetical protein E5X37_18150 [Mesorhizobium sp.]